MIIMFYRQVDGRLVAKEGSAEDKARINHSSVIGCVQIEGNGKPTERELEIARRAFFSGSLLEQCHPETHYYVEYLSRSYPPRRAKSSRRTLLRRVVDKMRALKMFRDRLIFWVNSSTDENE